MSEIKLLGDLHFGSFGKTSNSLHDSAINELSTCNIESCNDQRTASS